MRGVLNARCRAWSSASLLAALASAPLAAQSAGHSAQRVAPNAPYTDTAHHKAGFVRVQRGVRLHYLDFGGAGPAVVLLAGLGNTAHAFDDFAPALTDRFHVVALTRRGFGESDHPAGGYDIKRLVEDIRVAMDSLHIARASLVGHSIAGEELTRFAVTYPQRVDRLVYLDAAYDRVAAAEAFDAVFPVPPDVPSPPEPSASDRASARAYVDFVHRTRGVNIPESDIRTRYRYDGWDEQATVAYQAIQPERPNYRAVRAPALAIYAVTDAVSQLEPWQRDDSAHAAGLGELVRGTEYVEHGIRDEFRREVPNNQVLELHGAHHWIFVSDRDVVLRAVRAFLLAR
ncbi:MAG: alpha/beta fold hydrolase [Gemmatimonadales bacterium]